MRISKEKDYSHFVGIRATVMASDNQIREIYGPGVGFIRHGAEVNTTEYKVSEREGKQMLHIKCQGILSGVSIWYPYHFLDLDIEEEDDQE